MLPTAIPVRIPVKMLMGIRRCAGRKDRPKAVSTAAIAPAWSCPSAPIFNMPQREPNATASPVKARGMRLLMVLAMDFGLPKAPFKRAT